MYTGREYKKHSFLRSPDNISLTLNTDGVAVFKSSKCSLWPVWLVINELPPAERYVEIRCSVGFCLCIVCVCLFLSAL